MREHDFRRMALGLQGAVEGAHMGHPDFRVNGRIFATLHTGDLYGMVKLTPEQQQTLLEDHPRVFAPESGAWGRAGCTRVTLKAATPDVVGEALTLAWQNTSAAPERAKKPSRSTRPQSTRSSATAVKRSRKSSAKRAS
jgi:hypothetical protein